MKIDINSSESEAKKQIGKKVITNADGFSFVGLFIGFWNCTSIHYNSQTEKQFPAVCYPYNVVKIDDNIRIAVEQFETIEN